MKLYKTTCTDAEGIKRSAWDSSETTASKRRTAMAELYGIKRVDVKTLAFDVTPNKDGILAALNEHAC